MLQGVAENPESLKIVEAYTVIIRDMISVDGVTNWLEPLGQLVKWMATDDIKQMEAGV